MNLLTLLKKSSTEKIIFSTVSNSNAKVFNNRPGFPKAEQVARRYFVKKLFLKIPQNSQENTCARVSFLINFIHRTPTFAASVQAEWFFSIIRFSLSWSYKLHRNVSSRIIFEIKFFEIIIIPIKINFFKKFSPKFEWRSYFNQLINQL